jgi:uncharacterized protein YciI
MSAFVRREVAIMPSYSRRIHSMEDPTMMFAVLFEDDFDRADEVRRQHMQAHFGFLERNAAMIKAAGPLLDADGTPTGGLWLVEVTNREDVEQLVRDDPFWPTGLRRDVRVLAWHRVFADGMRCRAQR